MLKLPVSVATSPVSPSVTAPVKLPLTTGANSSTSLRLIVIVAVSVLAPAVAVIVNAKLGVVSASSCVLSATVIKPVVLSMLNAPEALPPVIA